MLATVSNAKVKGKHRQRFAFVLLCLALFMVVLDASIVNVALPSMQRDFGFSTATLQWVVSIYSLTYGSFLLLSGRAGDLFGRRRLFMGGLVLFSLASLAGGLAPSGIWFIMFRGIQGFGAALVAPTVLALVTALFEEGSARNRAFGMTGSISSLGFAVGALLGGLLVAGPGWRWVMFVNVPVGLLVLALAPVFLPETSIQTEHRQIDVLGAILITTGLIVLVYLLAEGNMLGWISGPELAGLALVVVLLLAFVLVEQRSRAPLVRFGIFRLRNLTGGNLVSFFGAATFVPVLSILTLYMQQTLGYSAMSTGLAFLPMALTLMVASNIISRQVTRIGVVWLMIGGLLVAELGLFLLTRISRGGTFVNPILPGTLVLALGFSGVFPGLFIAATSGVAPTEQGLASGLVNTTQQIGASVGMALVSTAIGVRSAALLQTGTHNLQVALIGGFQAGMFVCDRTYGRLDILVNNAGIFVGEWNTPPSQLLLADLQKTFAANFFGAFAVTKAVLPLLRRSRTGRIVNLSSEMGSLHLNSDANSPVATLPPTLAYNASKTALNALTIFLARELQDMPIKVNSVSPGYVATDLTGHSGDLTAEQGAKIPVAYATLPADGPTGGFFGVNGQIAW